MRIAAAIGLNLAIFWCAALADAAEHNPVRTHPPAQPQTTLQHVIVKFRTVAGAGETLAQAATDPVDGLVRRTGVALQSTRPIGLGLHVMHVRPAAAGESLTKTLARLRADPAVEYAEEDQRRYIHSVPNDPQYIDQWYEQTPTATIVSAVDAVTAWSITTGSTGVVIADIDTGVRYDHPDLLRAGAGGRLLPGYDFISDPFVANDGDGPDADASDPGDWVSQSDLSQPECSGASVANSSWHGTRTAGLLAALTNNGVGIAGMTWSAWLLPVRVIGKCGGTDSDIESAMLWAAGIHVDGVPDNVYPAKIENMSLGGSGSCPASFTTVINQLTAKGVLVVVSAGNEGGPVDAPGNCPGVVGVGGLRQAGTKVGFSSLGPELSLSAPAGNCFNLNITASTPCLYSIEATFNTSLTTPLPGTNSYTDEVVNLNLGTSFSAPIVTGIAGLMVAVNANLNSAQLITRLKEGSTPFPPSSSGESPQPPACHVPASANDIQDAECICTNDGQTCGAGMANASGALAAALRPIAAVVVTPASFAGATNVMLNAAGSAAACNHTINSFAWSIVNGGSSPPTITGAGTSTASVAAPTSGSFTVELTITDDLGRLDTADVVVSSTAASTTAPASAGTAATACPNTSAVDAATALAVTVSPNSASVQAAGGIQSFTAAIANSSTTAVTWQVGGVTGGNPTLGTISTSGIYTAPTAVPSPAMVAVTAVSVADPTRSGGVPVTITTPAAQLVTVNPASANVQADIGSRTFTAAIGGSPSTAVTWAVDGVVGGSSLVGAISTSGVYSAPGTVPTPATVSITATSSANTSNFGTAQVTVTAPIAVAVAPGSASVAADGGTQAFTATVMNSSNTAVTWQVNGVTGGSATVGTINTSGVYSAPAAVPVPATVTVAAVPMADSNQAAMVQVTVTAAASVTVTASSSSGGHGGGAFDATTLAVSLACLSVALRRRWRVRQTS